MSSKVVFAADYLTFWGRDILLKTGLSEREAMLVSENLVASNLSGVDTHGLVRIIPYAERVMKLKRSPISIMRETEATALIDGGQNLGQLVSAFAMDKAIEKAKKYGVGIASARNSNHFGTAAYYAIMAAHQEMIGFSATNASARIAPWGGADAIVGNNPFSFAIPGPDFPIVLDMATSSVAAGKIRIAAREGKPIPSEWGMDENGNPTTDPHEALKGLLAPVGGHKGVGLSVIMDLLCGALNQNGFSNTIERIDHTDKTQGAGHFFMAINVAFFLDISEFKTLIKEYTERFKSVRKREGFDEVFMPGEIEWRMAQERRVKGISLSSNEVAELNSLAQSLNVMELKG